LIMAERMLLEENMLLPIALIVNGFVFSAFSK